MPKTGDWGFGLGERRSLPKGGVYIAAVVIPSEPPPDETYTPSTQFNDLRNGQYVALLFEDF